MQPIYFCSHTRDRFAREFKQVERACNDDRKKKRQDELKRKQKLESQELTQLTNHIPI